MNPTKYVPHIVFGSLATAGAALVVISVDSIITSYKINKSRREYNEQLKATTETLKKATEKYVKLETEQEFKKIINDNF